MIYIRVTSGAMIFVRNGAQSVNMFQYTASTCGCSPGAHADILYIQGTHEHKYERV